MAEMGRPEIEWTKERAKLFETLMGIPFVTEEAVASVLEMSISTLSRRLKENYGVTFDELKREKHSGMKLKLAGKQYELAMKGNVVMAIWLGKQWLGQRDKQEIEQTNKTIEIKIGEDEKDA